MDNAKKILIIDEDEDVCRMLKTRFSTFGHTVYLSGKKDDPLTLLKKNPDLIILEILLSGKDGYFICSKLRQNTKIPIVFLTTLGSISDRVLGLNIGADDYIVKPFSLKELEVRINIILRNSSNDSYLEPFTLKSTLTINDLEIDIYRKKVFKQNKLVKLTSMEFNLLKFLILKSGEILTRPFILNNVWGYTTNRYNDTRVVDVYISRLRSKLGKNSLRDHHIFTIRGKGYMFKSF